MFMTVVANGQEQPKVIEKYEKHARIGNVFTQWFYNIRGTSTTWEVHLTLYDDQTYRFVYKGGECGTFDTDESGNWEKSKNILLLNDQKRYMIRENKLFFPDKPINKKAWVMKRVK